MAAKVGFGWLCEGKPRRSGEKMPRAFAATEKGNSAGEIIERGMQSLFDKMQVFPCIGVRKGTQSVADAP